MSQYIETIIKLKENIFSHNGFLELNTFGRNFEKKYLNEKNLKIFMATLWAFFRETPSGILCLSLRAYDFWSEINQWEAMNQSAYILSTAVDEFGLDNMRKVFSPTHHHLFKETAEYFGVFGDDLLSKQNVLPSGIEIGKACVLYYREMPLPVSMGFHLASELTSGYEFQNFLKGFWAHKEYYNVTSQKNSPLKFFWIHTQVEPSHLTNSEEMLENYLKILPDSIELIFSGALHYMKLYENLFKELNNTLFTEKVHQ